MNQNYEISDAYCNNIEIKKLDFIQSFGALLVVNKLDNKIVQASENVNKYFGIEAHEILNRDVGEALPELGLRESIRSLGTSNPAMIIKENYELHLHDSELYYVLEFLFIRHESELSYRSWGQLISGEEEISHCRASIELISLDDEVNDKTSVAKLCWLIAKKVKIELEVDRVLIYQFLNDGHGKVVADEKEEGMEDYLGLHFSRFDVPEQVKKMYLENPFRYICDCSEDPVSIIPYINPLTGNSLDMTHLIIRGLNPLHRIYLTNMHVRGTISYGIKVNNRLWGLISCHHRNPIEISYRKRMMLAHYSYLFSQNAFLTQPQRDLIISREHRFFILDLVKKIKQEEINLHDVFIEKGADILALVNASGGALCFEERISTIGTTPEGLALQKLAEWLFDNCKSRVFYTDFLSQLFPEAENYNKIASGLIAKSLGFESQNCLIWFRPQLSTIAKWAGYVPPDKLGPKGGASQLKPGDSFHRWQIEVRGHCQRWSVADVETIEYFIEECGNAILNQIYAKKLSIQENLNQLKDSFIRIVAHDLRNPISIINMASGVLECEELNENTRKMVEVIKKQSSSMLDLVNSTLNANLIQTGQFEVQKSLVDLREFFDEICSFNQMVANKKNVTIQVVYDLYCKSCDIDKIKIKQVVDNFLSNAIKITPEGTTIKVICKTTPAILHVEVQDQGPGIKGEEINRIFEVKPKTKFLTNGANEVHGLGLLICKQLISNLNGKIGILNTSEHGTTFYFEVDL